MSYIKIKCSTISRHTYVADYEFFIRSFNVQLISALVEHSNRVISESLSSDWYKAGNVKSRIEIKQSKQNGSHGYIMQICASQCLSADVSSYISKPSL